MVDETGLGGTDKLKMFIDLLSPDQKDQLLEILLQENKEKKKNYGEPIPELVGNFEMVLNDIEKHYIYRHNNEKKFGIEGTLISLRLPAVGNFEGFNYDFFVSKGRCSVHSFRNFTHDIDYVGKFCEKKEETYNDNSLWINGVNACSYSMEDFGYILGKINDYLNVYGVGNDDSYSRGRNDAVVLNKILGCSVWLKDIIPGGRVYRYRDRFSYTWDKDDKCSLLLKDPLYR